MPPSKSLIGTCTIPNLSYRSQPSYRAWSHIAAAWTFLCLVAAVGAQLPPPPTIRASAAILVDAGTGQVLFAHNPDLRRPPASTTKIMTAILLLENLPLDTLVAADKQASETDGSSLYMRVGERISAEDLLYGIMLRSANDACVAVAKAVGGSINGFVAMMNRKAAALGATNTHFANPNGLHAPDHYTTARDLARIACYAVQNPTFNEVVRTRYRVIARDPANKDVYLKNHAKFLWYYPGADGIKTGYTVPAGRCFVGSATRRGWRLITVVLNSPDIYGETRALLDYGFAAYHPVVVLPSGARVAEAPVTHGLRRVVPALTVSELRYVAPRDEVSRADVRVSLQPLTAPVPQGIRIGSAEAVAAGKVVARTDLVASARVESMPRTPARSALTWRALGTIVAVGLFLYGSAHSKAPRRRGRGLETGLRDVDALGACDGQRSASNGAGSQGGPGTR